MAKDSPKAAVLHELQTLGIPAQVHLGRHVKIWFEVDGRRLCYTVPSTSGDRRAAYNCRAGVRRLLRENGLKLS
jgi:hypothetical protein